MSGGPVFVTGLADAGKSPLARMLTSRTSIVITRHTQRWRLIAHHAGDHAPFADGARTAALAPPSPRGTRHLGTRRWGEQSNELEGYADRLLRALPDARVVHLVRDPFDAYRIVVRRRGDRPGRLGRYTARWMASAELALRNVARFPGRYLLVRYEDLATATDLTMREVCAFLDEPVGDAPFSFDHVAIDGAAGSGGKYASGAVANGSHVRVGQDRFIAHHARRQLRLLGYDGPRVDPVRVPDPWYLARWPAERLALAVTRATS